MKTLSRAIASAGAVGKPIALPWRALNEVVNLRTKELVMLAGAPGGGKSTVAVNLAIGANMPVLYCAQDSPASVLSRLTGLTLGRESSTIQNALASDSMRPAVVEQMRGKHPLLVVNRGPVETSRLRDMCVALTEWIGHPPPLIFVDNLIDLIVPGHSHHDTTFYSVALPELKRLAEDMDSCVVVLHHVTRGGGEAHGQGQQPLRMNDLLYAGEREARHVWGVYNNGAGVLKVQVLKQQDGPADPAGGMEVPLRWYPRLTKLVSWDE